MLTHVSLKGKNILKWTKKKDNVYTGKPIKFGVDKVKIKSKWYFPKVTTFKEYVSLVKGMDFDELKGKTVGCICEDSKTCQTRWLLTSIEKKEKAEKIYRQKKNPWIGSIDVLTCPFYSDMLSKDSEKRCQEMEKRFEEVMEGVPSYKFIMSYERVCIMNTLTSLFPKPDGMDKKRYRDIAVFYTKYIKENSSFTDEMSCTNFPPNLFEEPHMSKQFEKVKKTTLVNMPKELLNLEGAEGVEGVEGV